MLAAMEHSLLHSCKCMAKVTMPYCREMLHWEETALSTKMEAECADTRLAFGHWERTAEGDSTLLINQLKFGPSVALSLD